MIHAEGPGHIPVLSQGTNGLAEVGAIEQELYEEPHDDRGYEGGQLRRCEGEVTDLE